MIGRGVPPFLAELNGACVLLCMVQGSSTKCTCMHESAIDTDRLLMARFYSASIRF